MNFLKTQIPTFYKMLFVITAVWLAINNTSQASILEATYSTPFCNQKKGIIEYKIIDPTIKKLQGRVDCLIEHYAIEVDFGKKYAECIGQALFYAMYTGRTAGCALITKKNSRFLKRAESVRDHYNLPLEFWTIAP